jgi:hypothetical protein
MAVKDEENGRQRRRRFGFMRCSPSPHEGGRMRRTGSSRSTITSAGRRDSSLSSQRSSKGGGLTTANVLTVRNDPQADASH